MALTKTTRRKTPIPKNPFKKGKLPLTKLSPSKTNLNVRAGEILEMGGQLMNLVW